MKRRGFLAALGAAAAAPLLPALPAPAEPVAAGDWLGSVYVGGTVSRDTAFFLRAIRLAYANPGRMGLIVSPTYLMSRELAANFNDELKCHGLDWVYRVQAREIYFPNCGSRIRFRSAHDPRQLRGLNIAWYAVNDDGDVAIPQQADWLLLRALMYGSTGSGENVGFYRSGMEGVHA